MFALLLICLGAMGAGASDFTDLGPFARATEYFGVEMPESTGCSGRICALKVTITKPVVDTGRPSQASREPPFPIVFMFNGFQTYASYYKEYVALLVSYGYIVVQYDTKKMSMIKDRVEMSFFPHLLDWTRDLDAQYGSFLHNMVDFSKVGVAGHSRGGKLAAYHAANEELVKSAYLIDPVDGDNHYAKESLDYPSAVKVLAQKNMKVGIVGSGITGRCNPEGHNYKQFFEASGTGSWLTVVNAAGHCQYITAPPLFELIMDMMCGHGHDSCKDVISITRPGMVAWFEEELHGGPEQKRSFTNGQEYVEVGNILEAFFAWIKSLEKKHVVQFSMKGGEELPSNSYATT